MAGIAMLAGLARSAHAGVPASVLAAAEERLAPYFATRGIPYPPRAVAFVALKAEARLEVWAGDEAAWTFVRSYLVRSSSGRLGPKLAQGDHQVPEGVYRLDLLNPDSRYHLSMRIDYPNAFDRARARDDGRSRLGGNVMIHGDRVSDGCLPVGDTAVEELFALTTRVGMEHVVVIVSPTDLRRVDPRVAVAQAAPRPPWLHDLYADIARALREFPLPARRDAPVAGSPRPVVTMPRCRAHDAADCARRCQSGDMASCARAGLLYEDGWGVAADQTMAWPFLQKACAGGDAFGCAELSRLHLADDGLERDATRAAELAQAACDAGDGHGCYYLARLCADHVLYPGPRERCSAARLPRLYEQAVATLRKDCRGWGADDCHTLAAIYADGDPATAVRFAVGSCDAGDPRGCADLRRLGGDATRTRASSP